MQNAFVSANTDSNALVRSMRLRKRENVKTTIKRKREKKNREKGAKREKEKGAKTEKGETLVHVTGGSPLGGWIVEWKAESPYTLMKKKVQVRPHLTRLCSTAHPSSLLPSFLSPFFSFFFFFFSALLLFSIPSIFFPLAVGVLLRTSAMVYALLSGNVKTQQPM